MVSKNRCIGCSGVSQPKMRQRVAQKKIAEIVGAGCRGDRVHREQRQPKNDRERRQK